MRNQHPPPWRGLYVIRIPIPGNQQCLGSDSELMFFYQDYGLGRGNGNMMISVFWSLAGSGVLGYKFTSVGLLIGVDGPYGVSNFPLCFPNEFRNLESKLYSAGVHAL
ncbi:hypothetical protein BDZ94DRAFT_1237884 [Collybia nuda]|uniref:Uncharacterized protein n=1 Tax=Collybia nuda TaxID=64659 RepID=A0A9P6CCX1_9AGAR|nr:hypothetical protein BDZ94DRAFT_1237884 [Collybia nuda]